MPSLHKRPVGGWIHAGESYRMQRQDQGQDFEIPLHHDVIAPGWGKCVGWLHDGPFPNGFGSPYAVVWIGSGRFKVDGGLWYLGHANHVYVRPGQWFHTGQRLARLDNSLNHGWGWIEIGHAAGGQPGPNGTGAKYASLFQSPAWIWTR
jgi:hypothetical protein